jgi:hypothetical protein
MEKGCRHCILLDGATFTEIRLNVGLLLPLRAGADILINSGTSLLQELTVMTVLYLEIEHTNSIRVRSFLQAGRISRCSICATSKRSGILR